MLLYGVWYRIAWFGPYLGSSVSPHGYEADARGVYKRTSLAQSATDFIHTILSALSLRAAMCNQDTDRRQAFSLHTLELSNGLNDRNFLHP